MERLQINGLAIEIFEVRYDAPWDKELFPTEGWYWWVRGQHLPADSDPYGAFETDVLALEDAMNTLRGEEAA